MKYVLETLLTLLVIAAVFAGFYNVYSDNHVVSRMAEDAACAGRGSKCRVDGTLMIRSPIAQSFDYLIGGKPVHVRCAREYLLVGDYTCSADGAGVSIPSGAAPSSRAPSVPSGKR